MMLVDFLHAEISQDDMAATLRVLRRFKSLESPSEWAMADAMWVRFEQLEEYLAHRVNGDDLAESTVKFLAHIRK